MTGRPNTLMTPQLCSAASRSPDSVTGKSGNILGNHLRAHTVEPSLDSIRNGPTSQVELGFPAPSLWKGEEPRQPSNR